MYSDIFKYISETPALYAPSTAPFWDDEHISKQMLLAHLDEHTDAASRKPAFIRESAHWIAEICSPACGKALIDLGCGPGLYAEKFYELGFQVTGVDLSKRSIAYAEAHAQKANLPIAYRCSNYLELNDQAAYDVATLIYCDFGVLSPADRSALLARVFSALKPGGKLILDAHTPGMLSGLHLGTSAQYCERGFWSAEPHLCIEQDMYFKESMNTLDRYVVVTSHGCERYNIWNQLFTADTLARELTHAGFETPAYYDDVAGAPYSGNAATICAVASKRSAV